MPWTIDDVRLIAWLSPIWDAWRKLLSGANTSGLCRLQTFELFQMRMDSIILCS